MILVNAWEWLAACHGIPQKVAGKFAHRHSKLHTHSLYSSLSLLPTPTVIKYPISMLNLRSKVTQSSNPFQ